MRHLFIIFNHFKAPANRLFLTDYLFDNVIFISLSNEIMKAKYYDNKYPAFFYAEQIVNGNEFVPYFAKDKKEAERAYRQCSNKYSPINHFIIFNNDLNDIDPIRENGEIEQKEETLKEEMLRVGKKVVVSFPNFAYWKVRFYLFFKGRMPKSKVLPFEWFDTPNIHLLTINDFYEFCHKRNINILQSIYMTRAKVRRGMLIRAISNFFTEEVMFVISR